MCIGNKTSKWKTAGAVFVMVAGIGLLAAVIGLAIAVGSCGDSDNKGETKAKVDLNAKCTYTSQCRDMYAYCSRNGNTSTCRCRDGASTIDGICDYRPRLGEKCDPEGFTCSDLKAECDSSTHTCKCVKMYNYTLLKDNGEKCVPDTERCHKQECSDVNGTKMCFETYQVIIAIIVAGIVISILLLTVIVQYCRNKFC